jgi:hypothetical protein
MPFYSRFDHYQKNATASALQSMQAPPPPYFNVWHFQTSTATLDSCFMQMVEGNNIRSMKTVRANSP